MLVFLLAIPIFLNFHQVIIGLCTYSTLVFQNSSWYTYITFLAVANQFFMFLVKFRIIPIFCSWSVGGGTTWHAAGLLGIFKPTLAQVKLCQSSVALYKELEEQGYPTGWKECGSLCVARTSDRMTVYRRMKAQSVWVAQSFPLLEIILG